MTRLDSQYTQHDWKISHQDSLSREKMKILKLIILLIFTISCTSTSDTKSWLGNYIFEEKPIKSIADYYMVMSWNIENKEENKEIIAQIEVEGQQTYTVIKANVIGDEEKIALIFNSANVGVNYENFNKGDTLVVLSKEDQNIITTWKKLNPRLEENFENEKVYFLRERK